MSNFGGNSCQRVVLRSIYSIQSKSSYLNPMKLHQNLEKQNLIFFFKKKKAGTLGFQ